MKRVIIVLLLLSGCSGLSYALENYSGVDPLSFNYDEQYFRVFDKPAENRLMITPTVGAAAVQGGTFGGVKTPETVYQQATLAFLKSTGRDCRISTFALVAQPQWEAFYSCG